MVTERESRLFWPQRSTKRGQRAGVTAQESLGELGLLLLLLGDSGKGALPLETNTSHVPIPTHAGLVHKLGM